MKYKRGQALITMLFIIVIGVLIATGAVFVLYTNTAVASSDELGLGAKAAAESGIENGILRLIRNPAYTGETLTLTGNRTAVVTVASSSSIFITSTGTQGNISRQVQAALQYVQGILTIVSWKEIF